MSSFVPLRYYLPKTVVGVHARIHYVVVFDELGGHLEARSDLEVAPRVVADRDARCTTSVESGALESGAFAVEFTPDGLVGAIGAPLPPTPPGVLDTLPWSGRASQADVDGPAQGDAQELAQRATWTRAGALRVAFNRTHPRTAALIADLSARAEQFLAGMRMSDGPTEVETFGQALAIVERELAAADRMRREWIAGQGFEVRRGVWDLDLSGLVSLGEAVPPPRLPEDTPIPEGDAAVLAEQYGALLVVLDPGLSPVENTNVQMSDPERLNRVDEVVVRRSRPVTLVTYRRAPSGVGELAETGAEWVRDDALTQHLDIVDGASPLDVFAPQSPMFGDRPLQLVFHPDGSLRKFGAAAESAVGPSVAAPAPAGTSPTRMPEPAEVAAAAVEAARLQLALLNSSDEFTRLASTHAHGGELATLEQDARFAALRARRP
jgi:hypothetical protein